MLAMIASVVTLALLSFLFVYVWNKGYASGEAQTEAKMDAAFVETQAIIKAIKDERDAECKCRQHVQRECELLSRGNEEMLKECESLQGQLQALRDSLTVESEVEKERDRLRDALTAKHEECQQVACERDNLIQLSEEKQKDNQQLLSDLEVHRQKINVIRDVIR